MLPTRYIAKSALWLTITGILVAGLWPFDFRAQNNVTALPQRGLHITHYGQILSSIPFQESGRSEESSVEFWFQPAGAGYAYDSQILSFSDGKIVNFGIGQSGRDLYAAVLSPGETGLTALRKLWVDGACGTNQPLFVTVTSSGEDAAVYLDGHLTRSFLLPISRKTFSGTIILGHTPIGDQPWSGDLFGMASYDRTLNADEIIRHVDLWLRGRTTQLNQDGAILLYDFRSASPDSVRNLGRRGPDLLIPTRFYARNKSILGWPTTWNRASVSDAIVNVAGFIPLGFLLVLTSSDVSRKSAPIVLGTAVSIATALSLSIELLQVYLPSRDSSLSDLLTNILGSAIGAGLGVVFRIHGRRQLLDKADPSRVTDQNFNPKLR